MLKAIVRASSNPTLGSSHLKMKRVPIDMNIAIKAILHNIPL
jgi:hypothetical protein